MKKWVVAGLLMVGIIWTARDYLVWRKQDRGDYGHGWGENKNLGQAMELVGPYVNTKERWRIRYPKGWDTIEIKDQNAKIKNIQFIYPFALTVEGDRPEVRVSVMETKRSMADEAGAKAAELAKSGLAVKGDWAYFSTDRIDLVVLTWEEGKNTRQWALGQKGGRYMQIEAKCPTGNWNAFAKTFEEMYKSLVVY